MIVRVEGWPGKKLGVGLTGEVVVEQVEMEVEVEVLRTNYERGRHLKQRGPPSVYTIGSHDSIQTSRR